jgi:hypothetical protein
LGGYIISEPAHRQLKYRLGKQEQFRQDFANAHLVINFSKQGDDNVIPVAIKKMNIRGCGYPRRMII